MNKGRLEGRLTMDPEKAAGNKNRGGRREDQQLNNNKNRDAIVEKMEKVHFPLTHRSFIVFRQMEHLARSSETAVAVILRRKL